MGHTKHEKTTTKPKAPVADADPTKSGPGKGSDKSALKSLDFAAGENALKPKDLGPKGDKAGGKPGDKGKAPVSKPAAPGPDKQVIDDTNPAKAPTDEPWKKYVGQGDDEATVKYLVGSKDVRPDGIDKFTKLVAGTRGIGRLKTRGVYDHYRAYASDEELQAVMLYTTDAAYAMNSILRGGIASQPWLASYGLWIARAESALKKLPKGARNKQDDTKLDAKKGDDDFVSYNETYRADAWNPQFLPVFANEYTQGRVFEEPGFFSTAVAKGAYGDDMPVQRTVQNAKVSRSIYDLSLKQDEKEALFAPRQRFKVQSIEVEDTKKGGGKQKVTRPLALFPQQDGGPNAFNRDGLKWHVTLKQVGVAKGKKPAPDAAAQGTGKDGAKDGKSGAKDGAKKATFLEKLLGIAYVED